MPPPQSELEPQLPSGALAHLPERQAAPPQSELDPHDDPAAVAHLPERQLTPGPQSELEPHDEPARALGGATRAAARKEAASQRRMRILLW